MKGSPERSIKAVVVEDEVKLGTYISIIPRSYLQIFLCRLWTVWSLPEGLSIVTREWLL